MPYYFINKFGQIFSSYNEKLRLLKQDKDKDGYFRVSLQCDSGKRRSFRVNRLVAIIFLPNPKNLPIVDHLDGNKENNHVDNLEWVSASENTRRGYVYNNYHFVKKINVIKENEVIKTFNSIKECAEFYNTKYFDISKIINHKIFPHKKGKIANLNFEFVVEKCID